jgi:hypothetical protein
VPGLLGLDLGLRRLRHERLVRRRPDRLVVARLGDLDQRLGGLAADQVEGVVAQRQLVGRLVAVPLRSPVSNVPDRTQRPVSRR